MQFTSHHNLVSHSKFTCIEALNADALKLTTTELIETYIPSIMRSAKPYFPPVLKMDEKIISLFPLLLQYFDAITLHEKNSQKVNQ